MLHKKINYTDYDGNQVEETFLFNLTKAELMRMELSTSGGVQNMVQTLIAKRDGAKIMEVFEDLILKSYGEKSPDGKRFIKSPELSEAFKQTEAYSELFCELCTNAEAAAEFFNGIVPPDIAAEAEKNKNVDLLPDIKINPAS